ncbi:hypothetical protein N7527_004864 [Penicillium freii]|nr:hypothetical protein N7527_004864 [Penicillium freii]
MSLTAREQAENRILADGSNLSLLGLDKETLLTSASSWTAFDSPLLSCGAVGDSGAFYSSDASEA